MIRQIAELRDALLSADRMPPFLLDSALAAAQKALAQATRSDLSEAEVAGLPAFLTPLQDLATSSGQVRTDLEAATRHHVCERRLAGEAHRPPEGRDDRARPEPPVPIWMATGISNSSARAK